MVALGTVNSRMKDFFDLWYMANSMEFELDVLREAIQNTFQQRNTPPPEKIPIALTSEFTAQKQVQWVAFLRKSPMMVAPTNFLEVILMGFDAQSRSNRDFTINRGCHRAL
jgi:hypothetical protein